MCSVDDGSGSGPKCARYTHATTTTRILFSLVVETHDSRILASSSYYWIGKQYIFLWNTPPLARQSLGGKWSTSRVQGSNRHCTMVRSFPYHDKQTERCIRIPIEKRFYYTVVCCVLFIVHYYNTVGLFLDPANKKVGTCLALWFLLCPKTGPYAKPKRFSFGPMIASSLRSKR